MPPSCRGRLSGGTCSFPIPLTGLELDMTILSYLKINEVIKNKVIRFKRDMDVQFGWKLSKEEEI